MAKNFTDFEKLEGNYTAPTYPPGDPGGYQTGISVTQVTSGMHLVGYDTDQPHGERQYTVESVLLAAQPYHVGLENVTNESKEVMFDGTAFTGSTSAYDLIVENNLTVLGETTQLNTKTFATSAFAIRNLGTTTALKVEQAGSDTLAQFWDGDEITLELADGGKVGILGPASTDHDVTIYGTISAYGPLRTRDHVNGRDMTQDGYKLDRIKVNADVTSVALSSVSSDLAWLKANVPSYANVVVDEGLDLLEDGSDYKKIPALSGTDNTYSVQKIKSIEDGADVTGDHSADIILNDVPDGPWTSNSATTFVKMTSAQSERVTTVRGVSASLYATDDGGDINKMDIVKAYQEGYAFFWSESDDNDYNNNVKPLLADIATNVQDISSRRDAVITEVESNSGDWNNVYSDVSTTSANWNEAYNDYTAVQTRRDAVITEVESNSGDWNNVYSDVSTTSGNWDSTHTKMQQSSDDWDSTHTSVNGASGTWNNSVNNIDNEGLPHGQAKLSHLSVSTSLSTMGETYVTGTVQALTADEAGTPEWITGKTEIVDVGGTWLQFIDGIMVKSYPDPNLPD